MPVQLALSRKPETAKMILAKHFTFGPLEMPPTSLPLLPSSHEEAKKKGRRRFLAMRCENIKKLRDKGELE